MAATICPTVTARDTAEYKFQMEKVAQFATRVHIDLADGVFTPVKLTDLADVWWPGGMRADLHIMYKWPFEYIQTFLALKPQMVVIHAEADGEFEEFAGIMHSNGIEVGVALKADTPPELLRPALDLIDHVLVFSGNLGHFGGQADMRLIDKVKYLRGLKPQLEIGWDGGINAGNASGLAMHGVDVLNVGGFIQHAQDPAAAYRGLQRLVASLQK